MMKPAFPKISVGENAQAAPPVDMINKYQFPPVKLGFLQGGEFSLFRAVWFFLFGEKKKVDKKGEERK